jgi:zinc transport system ATP-binding protein
MRFSVPIFEINALHLEIGGQKILENISMRIFAGEYDAIIGPNGGGKTTLVRILLGLQETTSGDVKIFGKELKKFDGWDKIGYVPQRASLVDPSFPVSALDVVKMGRTAKKGFFGRFGTADKKCVYDAMEKMDVLDLSQKMIGSLSGGQRQRVMIARALASEPKVLILDEPNTGVDITSQKLFYSLLRRLNKEEGLTILFITHDIGVIVDDIDRLFTVNRKLLTCNNPKESVSCGDMSELYGTNAHLLHNHHVH